MNNKTQGKDYAMTDVKQRHKLRQKTLNRTQAYFRRHEHTERINDIFHQR